MDLEEPFLNHDREPEMEGKLLISTNFVFSLFEYCNKNKHLKHLILNVSRHHFTHSTNDQFVFCLTC